MKNLTILIVFALIISSCSPKITMVDTSCPGYKSPDLKKEEISEKGIGIMPVLGGAEREEFRRPMGDAIYSEFRKKFGDNVKSTRDVISILNENNISDDYSRAIENYVISGVVPKDMVQNLGIALGVNYLLYSRLLTAREYAQISTGTYTSTTVNIDEFYIQTQIWDTNIGDVVWEGKGGIAKIPADQSNVINETAKGLANILGNDQYQGPCQESGELVKSLQEATTNTYLAVLGVSLLVLVVLSAGL